MATWPMSDSGCRARIGRLGGAHAYSATLLPSTALSWMDLRSTTSAGWTWLRSRTWELALFLLGVLLRVSMTWSYDAKWSYDADGHWWVIEWMLAHHRVPPPDAVLHAFHPPLWYALAAWLIAHGVSRADLVWISIACGTVRLAVIWAGLELYLPGARLARLAALALAAVLAASVHPDGMIYTEAMSCMWISLVLLLVPRAFQRPPRTRWRHTGLIGLLLGLSMLTKISGAVVIISISAAALLEFVFSARPWKRRAADLVSWAAMLAACLAVCGWYFARNVRDYGRPFVTSFDFSLHRLIAPYDEVPGLDRRTVGYFVGWDPAVQVWPFFPAGIQPYPRFFPVAIASTFTDYWNFSFSGLDPAIATGMKEEANARPVSKELLSVARGAVLGGLAIFASVVIAWALAVRALFRQRDFGILAVTLVPAFTLAAALQFAALYPLDKYGVVKGIYMQFGSAPLYALFGLAVAWARGHRLRWPLFAALGLALWLVTAYTVWCRLRVPLVPLSGANDANLALHGSASASSRAYETSAAGAIDGIRYGQLGFHSEAEASPWFTLDLGQPHRIERVEVYGRGDCCFDQSVPLALEISENGTEFTAIATRQKAFSQYRPWVVRPQPPTARFLRLRTLRQSHLVLGEVEVYGQPSAAAATPR
jgi:F5/8 type C domain